jgi:hypothetical protein
MVLPPPNSATSLTHGALGTLHIQTLVSGHENFGYYRMWKTVRKNKTELEGIANIQRTLMRTYGLR